MVTMEVQFSDGWYQMLVRIAEGLRARGTEVTPELVVPAMVKLGLRAAGVEAVEAGATDLALAQFSAAELDQLDSALAKLILRGARLT
jgi:hypothetical protein